MFQNTDLFTTKITRIRFQKYVAEQKKLYFYKRFFKYQNIFVSGISNNKEHLPEIVDNSAKVIAQFRPCISHFVDKETIFFFKVYIKIYFLSYSLMPLIIVSNFGMKYTCNFFLNI